jgi:hypothetical protein
MCCSCCACRRSFREDNLEPHEEKEIRRFGETAVILRIRLRLTKPVDDRCRGRTLYYREKATALEGIELDSRFDTFGKRLSSDASKVPVIRRDAESLERRKA